MKNPTHNAEMAKKALSTIPHAIPKDVPKDHHSSAVFPLLKMQDSLSAQGAPNNINPTRAKQPNAEVSLHISTATDSSTATVRFPMPSVPLAFET